MSVVGPKNLSSPELAALKQQLEHLDAPKAKAAAQQILEAPLPATSQQSQGAGRPDASPRVKGASEPELVAAIEKAKPEVLSKLRSIILQLEDASIPAAPEKATLSELTKGADAVYYRRQDLDKVYRMLRALPAAVQKAFPMAQLEALEKALSTKQAELEKYERALKGAQQPPKAPAYVPSTYSFQPQEVKPAVPVLLRPEAMPTLDSAAEKLGALLSDPGLPAKILAAAPAGAAAEAYLNAVRSTAMLVDYAAGSLDYTRVGENGWGIKNRGAHQARAYGPGDKGASAPRQDASRQALKGAIEEALAQGGPTKALEQLVTDRFLVEVGIPKDAAKGWKPSFAGVTQALKDELFVPLRAINELLERSMGFGYNAADRAKGKQIAAEMTRAVSEGRFEDWRRSIPENVVQLQALSDAQREGFLDTLRTEAEHGGKKYSSREGAGPDLFWATKTGGPSHGFDVMARCVMALLTNLRTKVIQIEDSSFPLVAARAYLKLIDRPNGEKPMLALEGVQFDFGYFGDRGAVKTQIFTHAAEKAKALGLELVALSYEYQGVGGAMGGLKSGERSALIHPVALLEASDYMGPTHDGPIKQPVVTKLGGLIYTP